MLGFTARRLAMLFLAVLLLDSCAGGNPPTSSEDILTDGPRDTLPDTKPDEVDKDTPEDLVPDVRDVKDTVQLDLVDTLPELSVDTVPEVVTCPNLCSTQQQCTEMFPDLKACEEAVCEFDLACDATVCKVKPIPFPCCESIKGCPADNPCLKLEGCVAKVCSYSPLYADPNCCQDLTVESFTFEKGLPSANKLVLQDNNLEDAVGWSLQQDPCGLGKALYFGNYECLTYFNGQLDECRPVEDIDCTVETQETDCPEPKKACNAATGKCKPSFASTAVSSALVVQEVNLPKDTFVSLTFRLWIETEPDDPQSNMYFDVLKLHVMKNGQSVDVPFTSVGRKNSGNTCVSYAVDLSAWAGTSIDLRFEFKADNTNNNYRGFFIDDVRVGTFCKTCSKPADCNDSSLCTIDACAMFTAEQGIGTCVNNLEDPYCALCSKAEDCVNVGPHPGDNCWIAGCTGGKCVWSPNPGCCSEEKAGEVWTEGFQGELGVSRWTFAAPAGSNTGWSIVEDAEAPGGADASSVLYFGDEAQGTYDCGLDVCPDCEYASCNGTATSKEIDLTGLETQFHIKLSFSLKLSTEWDETTPDKYPAGNAHSAMMADVLFVEVVSAGDSRVVEVWNSDMVKGSTRGAYAVQWADLTAFAGQKVKLRFRFDSGITLPSRNGYGGAWVDDLLLETVCYDVCNATSDCGTAPSCRTVACQEGICRFDVIPECCTADFNTDCTDPDPCTNDSCDQQKKTCNHVFNGDTTCCHAYASVFTEGFEDSSTLINPASPTGCGNTVCGEGEDCANCPQDCKECPVRWQVSTARKSSGARSAYFGNAATKTFADGTKEVVDQFYTKDIVMPSYGVPVLDFMLFLDTEHTQTFELFVEPFEADLLKVYVQKKDLTKTPPVYGTAVEIWNSNSWDFKGSTYSPESAVPIWKKVSVGMAKKGLSGATVRFMFKFDSINGEYNDYEGAYVDDLKLYTLCDASYECSSPVECPDVLPENPNCTIESCQSGSCISKSNVAKTGCCAQVPLEKGEYHFDSCTLQNWTAKPSVGVVKWQASSFRNATVEGACAAYFGNQSKKNYDDSGKIVKGLLTSPEIDVTGYSKLEVSFKLWMSVEDVFWFSDTLSFGIYNVLEAGKEPQINSYQELWHKPCSKDLDTMECDFAVPLTPCNTYGCQNFAWGQWVTITKTLDFSKVPLSTYGFPGLPKLVVFRFSFDSGDPSSNTYEGVYVDDFVLRTVCE